MFHLVGVDYLKFIARVIFKIVESFERFVEYGERKLS